MQATLLDYLISHVTLNDFLGHWWNHEAWIPSEKHFAKILEFFEATSNLDLAEVVVPFDQVLSVTLYSTRILVCSSDL